MKHTRKHWLAAALALLMLLFGTVFVSAADASPDTVLKFGDDGKFTILHLTDTQDDQYPAKELRSFLKTAIETANPDLIIFTGDLVEDTRFGDFKDDFGIWEGVTVPGNKAKTRENAIKAASFVLEILSDSGVPFAMVQGNNDYKVNVDNESWLNLYDRYPGNLTVDMSENSSGIDYRLPVYSADGSEVKLNLYCLDTQTSGIDTASVDWYKADSDAQKAAHQTTVPAFAFQHIPVDEISNLFTVCDAKDPDGVTAVTDAGIRRYKLAPGAHGYFSTIYQSDGESEEFAAWKQQGDVVAGFFGHMHQDGYSGTYDGIELNLTYGCEFAKSGPYGMRVITVDEEDVTKYENTTYTYADGAFTADPYTAPQRSFMDKVGLFIDSLLYIAKTLIKKVLPL